MRSVVVGVVVGLVTVVSPSRGTASVPDGSEFCAALDAFFATAEPPVEGDDVVVLDADQQAALVAWADEFEEALDGLVASAPEEIAADIQVVDDVYSELLGLVRETDFGDAASVDAFNEAAAAWEENPFGTSFLAILGYADTACGDGTGALSGPSCILSADDVAAVTGVEVVSDTGVVGAMSIGAIDLLEPQPTTTDEDAAPSGSLQWTGCQYDASDGTEFEVGELIDAAGEPDPGQFERLAAVAVAPPEIADGAFVTTDGEVVVLAGDETMVFSVDVDLDVNGIGLLVGVADELLAGDFRDAEERCAWLSLRVPDEWGAPDPDMLTGSGTSAGISFSSCSYALPSLDGARLRLDWAEGQAWFDERAADAVPVAVDGLGEAAYRFEGHLFVLAGGHALVIEASEPVDAELATAAMEALGESTP